MTDKDGFIQPDPVNETSGQKLSEILAQLENIQEKLDEVNERLTEMGAGFLLGD